MTRLCVDPADLPFQFAKATPVHPQKLRFIGQVKFYDESQALLHVERLANLPPVHVHISLDTFSEREVAAAKTVPVDVAEVLFLLTRLAVTEGSVVSVWGIYDGEMIRAVECAVVNGQELLDGSAEVLSEVSKMKKI